MIGLVACSKTKLERPAPARELYASPLFRLALRYAKAQCEVVYVASALHGLVELDTVIEPYDLTLTELSPKLRLAWGHRVARELVGHSDETIVALAGASYMQPIRAALRELERGRAVAGGLQLIEPLHGMQIGERLAWLRAQAPREARS